LLKHKTEKAGLDRPYNSVAETFSLHNAGSAKVNGGKCWVIPESTKDNPLLSVKTAIETVKAQRIAGLFISQLLACKLIITVHLAKELFVKFVLSALFL